MEHMELIVYEADGTTAWLSVGTNPSHAHPYLLWPDNLGESEVDLLNGKAVISQISVSAIDPQSGATKQDRWFTAKLADTDGNSALNFHRAKLWYPVSGIVIQESVVYGSTLNDSFAGFTLTLRDTRERLRKIPAFTMTDTCTILPRGVKDGYGLQANGQYLIPATVPLRATVTDANTNAVEITLINPAYGATSINNRTSTKHEVIPELVLNADMIAACASVHSDYLPSGFKTYAPNVVAWWRETSGDTSWHTIANMQGVTPLVQKHTEQMPLVGQDSSVKYDVADKIFLTNYGGGTLPANGHTIEIMLQYAGPVTEKFPRHFEGTLGDVFTNLVTGVESNKVDSVTFDLLQPVPQLRYDSDALDAIDIPVRLRITKPIEDIRNAVEQACTQVAAAPALNTDGEMSPIFYHLPGDEELLQIDDTNCTAIAGWSHPADNAIRSTTYTYQRDSRVLLKDDPLCQSSGMDGIRVRDVIVKNGDQEDDSGHSVDGWLFHSLGNNQGSPIAGDATQEIGFQMASTITHAAIDRFRLGGQSSFARIMASDFPDVKAGDWLIDARPWRPNYATGTRGGNSLVQIASLRKINPEWFEVRLDEAGPDAEPLDVPTFDTPTLTDDNALSMEVLTIPTGAEFVIQIAVGDSEPTANSGVWAFLVRDDAVGVYLTAPLPFGQTIWARGRAVKPGARSSAWVSIGSETTPETPALTDADLIVTDDGGGVVTWTPNPFCLGVRIYHNVGAPGTIPSLTDYIDADAADGEYSFAADSVDPSDALTVSVEPWSGYSDPDVSGDAGAAVIIQRVRDGRQFVTGAFWAAPNNDGTADLALVVHGKPDAFPVTAEFYKDTPSGDPATTGVFEASGDTYSASDDAVLDDVKMLSKTPPAWWAKLLDSAGGTTWVPCVFAPVTAEASLEMTLKDFKVLAEDATSITYGWVRGALLDTVSVIVSTSGSPPTWPTTSDTPTDSLAGGTDLYVITKPTAIGESLDAIFFGVLVDGVTFGPVQSVTVNAYVPPGVPTIDIREVPGSASSDLFMSVTDASGSAGTLSVWVNHASDNSADPSGSADGSYAISSTPASVGPSTVFALTGGGTSTLLNDIQKPLNKRKRIFAEFVTDDGRTTGKRDWLLEDLQTLLIDTLGALKANVITDASQFLPSIRPIACYFDTLALKTTAGSTNPNTSARWLDGDTIYVNEDASFWNWNDGTSTFDSGTGTTLLTAAVVQAGSVRTVHLSSEFIAADLLIAQNAIIDSLLVGDLTIRGTLDGVDGTFSGDLSAAGGTFSGDISGASGTFTGDVSGASFTGADFTGVDFTGVDITGVTGAFSGTLSSAKVAVGGGGILFDDSGTVGSITAGDSVGPFGQYGIIVGMASGANLSISSNAGDLLGAQVEASVTFVCPGIVMGGKVFSVDGSGFVKAT